MLPPEAPLTAEHRPELLGGVTVITGKAECFATVAPPSRLL